MNSTQFESLLAQTFNSMQNLSNTKGKEYAGTDDRLSNFKRLGQALSLLPEKVLMVYLTKHLDSITTYINELEKPIKIELSEPIEGRIDDAILYLALLKGLIQERNGVPEKILPDVD